MTTSRHEPFALLLCLPVFIAAIELLDGGGILRPCARSLTRLNDWLAPIPPQLIRTSTPPQSSAADPPDSTTSDVGQHMHSPESSNSGDPLPCSAIRGHIICHSLTLIPTGWSTPVAGPVSLEAVSGHLILITGRAHTGKSTVLNLLAGCEWASSGTVFINGRDPAELPARERAEHLEFLPHNMPLPDTTLNDYLKSTSPELTTDRLTETLRAVELLDWLHQLPLGLHTRIGSTGIPVSPDVQQRIHLARLLITSPPCILLDEPLSGLEPGLACRLSRRLRSLLRSSTVVVASRSPHLWTSADHVTVLDSGRPIEQGTHSTLLPRNGLYTALHHSPGY